MIAEPQLAGFDAERGRELPDGFKFGVGDDAALEAADDRLIDAGGRLELFLREPSARSGFFQGEMLHGRDSRRIRICCQGLN